MEKKEGRKKSLEELEGILVPKYLDGLGGKQMKVREVEITYKVTLSQEEVLGDPRRAGLFARHEDPEEVVCQHELAELVKDLLSRKIITQRERNAVRLCFGIGCREHTPTEAARRMDTSPSSVRGAIKSALRKLRRHSKCSCLKQFHK